MCFRCCFDISLTSIYLDWIDMDFKGSGCFAGIAVLSGG
jgi:hypothetical protein